MHHQANFIDCPIFWDFYLKGIIRGGVVALYICSLDQCSFCLNKRMHIVHGDIFAAAPSYQYTQVHLANSHFHWYLLQFLHNLCLLWFRGVVSATVGPTAGRRFIQRELSCWNIRLLTALERLELISFFVVLTFPLNISLVPVLMLILFSAHIMV